MMLINLLTISHFRYWQEKTDFTPESRIELHQHIEEKRKQKEKKDDE